MTKNIPSDFVFNPASDESVDSEYIYLPNTNITIQCALYAGGYGVNSHGGEGNDFWCEMHGTYRSLDRAFVEARKVATAYTGE